MKLEPLEDYVVVTALEGEKVSKGGIHIPETAQKLANRAMVIAVGPGKHTEEGKMMPMPLKRGDIIIHAKYAGNEFEVEGTRYLALHLSDVMARVHGTGEIT